MIRRTLMFAAMALAMQGAMAKDWDSIRFATEGAYPPFNTVDTSGAVQGFDVDIANALCEEMKAKCTWVKQEWDGMIPALLSRKFDAISASMSITEERKKRVDFTDKYYATPLALVAKKGSGLVPELGALKGKRIGVQRGTVADAFATRFWADQGVNVVRYARQEEAYLDLSSGRIDAAWADALVADRLSPARPCRPLASPQAASVGAWPCLMRLRLAWRKRALRSGVVSTAATIGVFPAAPRPRLPPVRSPPR